MGRVVLTGRALRHFLTGQPAGSVPADGLCSAEPFPVGLPAPDPEDALAEFLTAAPRPCEGPATTAVISRAEITAAYRGSRPHAA
jgi:hypothetical protein